MRWTEAQQSVIESRGSNLIVSAAAGSGKTAVLVERICSLALDDGIDIDHMLVATFTRAAAAEMKSRIVRRFEQALSENASNRVHDQLLKVERAQIGTLHSFCGVLLTQHGHIVGLEPTFRTEDENVTQAMFDEALQETIDSFFEQGSAGFMELADCWGGRDGQGLFKLVTKAYFTARNHPGCMDWLKEKTAMFDFSDIKDTPWYGVLVDKLAYSLELAAASLDGAIAIASLNNGPATYLLRLQEDRQAVDGLAAALKSGGPDALPAALAQAVMFNRLPQWRDPQQTGLGKLAADYRKQAKANIEEVQESPIVCNPAVAVQHTRDMGRQMIALYSLVEAFDRAYTQEKRNNNILDFSDLEQLALAVLADDAAREDIRSTYTHVFVDEYQDISPIQDAILRKVSSDGTFFCVGDVKQSIYRFRSADPEIFIERLRRSSGKEDALERRIDLSMNFRSANQVVELANYLFRGLMSERLGDVDYGDKEQLIPGAPQPDVSLRDPNELILIDNAGKDEDELTRLEELIQIEREATVVANQIISIIGNPIWDGKRGMFRKAGYSDITVLLRTVSNVAADYAEVLRRSGIPVFTDVETGFSTEIEVQLLVNMLRLIDNSYRDYELICCMYSALGSFTIEDLVEVRGLYGGGSFAEAVERYSKENDTELADKINAFTGRVENWRSYARHSDIEKLVYKICDDTGFYEYAGTLPEGEFRQYNINQLATMARGYNAGLYDFIRNFDRLKAAGAKSRKTGQSAGAVSIMSVHKSKGLEFPVVILSNIGKKINMMDLNEDMLTQGELGLGPRYFNREKRTRSDTLARAALKERINADTLSEEMRMLYVALTRARERLIIVGTVPNLQKKLESWSLPVTPAVLRDKARCWADWIGPMALRCGLNALSEDMARPPAALAGPRDWQISVIPAEGITALRQQSPDKAKTLQALLNRLQGIEVPADIDLALSWKYPWGDVAALPSKVSATSLLDKQRNWRGPIPAPEIQRKPGFMEQKENFTATDLGTFVHTALQLLPQDITAQDIAPYVSDMERRGLLPEHAAKAIDIGWIERYLRSDIAERIRRSQRVQRELPFNLSIAASSIFDGETGSEDILVQGIIDCCFIEDGKWVLLDYKTNRVDAKNTVQKITEFYKPQLQIYTKALEEITGIEVKEACLYLLSVGIEAKVIK